MKITLACRGDSKTMKESAETLEKLFTDGGFKFSRYDIPDESGDTREFSRLFSSVDLIVLGGETASWDGGLSRELLEFLDRCPYIEGKKIAVFVTRKMMGSGGALRKLMDAVEKRGGFLFDFEEISGGKSAGDFAKRLFSIGKPDKT